jgi:hypothetical protein
MVSRPSNPSQTVQSTVGQSIESVFIVHYLQALDRLQSTWMDDDILNNQNAFSLQLEYLIRLIPDRQVQDDIRKEYQTTLKSINKHVDPWAAQRAGLIVVTSLIEFLTSSFDLLHVDIFGPGINAEYQDVVEIPDAPTHDVTPSTTPTPSETPTSTGEEPHAE